MFWKRLVTFSSIICSTSSTGIPASINRTGSPTGMPKSFRKLSRTLSCILAVSYFSSPKPPRFAASVGEIFKNIQRSG